MRKLVKCRYCGHSPIYPTAWRCPRCGGREPGSRRLEIVITLVILAGALWMAWRFWPQY